MDEGSQERLKLELLSSVASNTPDTQKALQCRALYSMFLADSPEQNHLLHILKFTL
jgi:hypothetical protein